MHTSVSQVCIFMHTLPKNDSSRRIINRKPPYTYKYTVQLLFHTRRHTIVTLYTLASFSADLFTN